MHACVNVRERPSFQCCLFLYRYEWYAMVPHFVCGCSVAVVGTRYSQIKFNLLNWHIIENKTDKKPGLFAAGFALLFMIGGGFEGGMLLVRTVSLHQATSTTQPSSLLSV